MKSENSWMLLVACLLLGLLPGCGRDVGVAAPVEGDEPGECSDGTDNDQDGAADCDDDGCAADAACTGDDDGPSGDDDDDDSTQGDDDDSAQGDDDDSAGDDDDDDTADDDDTTAEPPAAYIYAHTDTMLYEVDPETYATSLIGAFSGTNVLSQGVTDIAVDQLGNMWAVGFLEVYRVNLANAALTERTFDFGFITMNSMTFLADGRLLAGAQDRLYEVDTTSGATNVIQTFDGFHFAGDMVGLPDELLYMLMCVDTSPPCATSLVVMDLADMNYWELGPTGQGDMYGVAYYDTTELIYGFNEDGQIFLIDPSTGLATPVNDGGPAWWGATTNPSRWSG